jgi:hypothetical protein
MAARKKRVAPKPLTYGDLPKIPEAGVYMRCRECAENYSACRGDYWQTPDGRVAKCGWCGEHLVLVRKVVTYEPM